MRILTSLIAGLIFGAGLIISGMANPLKVQNFLDIFGTWDPSLAFVMGGAIAVTLPGYLFLRKKRQQPLFANKFQWPTKTDIDAKLLTGAAVFGVGWGIGGFCPGPALTSLSTGLMSTAIFVLAMFAGLYAAKKAKQHS